MANSSTHLDTISSSQAGKEITANAMFDAASPATVWGRRASTSSGLTWGFYGGYLRLPNGTHSLLANGTVALTASATNYVQADPASGAVSSSTTGFTAGNIPLYSVVTGASTVTSYTDFRVQSLKAMTRSVRAMSDANYTMDHGESRSEIVEFTGTLSAQRNVVVPLKVWQWTIFNNTTGGQNIQVIGATGTGVAIAAGKRAIVYCDGTNIVRVTPDT